MSQTDPLTFKVLTEIGIINQLSSSAFSQVLPRNMTIAQFSVLNHFVRLGHEFTSPGQLANAFQVSRPTMSNTLARLERSGYITIAPDPEDGRAKRVSITPDGHDMRGECLTRLQRPLLDMQTQVPAELIVKLDPLLTQLREILDEMRN